MKRIHWVITLLLVAAIVGVAVGKVYAASLLATNVAAAGQITLTSAVETTSIKLTHLGSVTTTFTNNPKTAPGYVYTVSLYIDGVLQPDSATVSWPGVFTTPEARLVPLMIPEGMLNWTRLTVVVTP
jgi:hypothetical protein